MPDGYAIVTGDPVEMTVGPAPAKRMRGAVTAGLAALVGRDHVAVESRINTGCSEYVYVASTIAVRSIHVTVPPETTGASAPVHTSVVPADEVRATRYVASIPADVVTRFHASEIPDEATAVVIVGADCGTNVAPEKP